MINKGVILNPDTEYDRQVEIEKLLNLEVSEEMRSLLNSIETSHIYTNITIGLVLKSTDDLNIARLLILTEDPEEESPLKNKALEIVKKVNVEEVLDRISERIHKDDLNEVERTVFYDLFNQDYIL